MNVEHSDVRACTQGVYSCFIKRLLRDYRQQHPQSSDTSLYICGHITEDYDQETESIQYPHFSGDARTDCTRLPRKKWPGNEARDEDALLQ